MDAAHKKSPCIFTQQQLALFSMTSAPGNTIADYDLCPRYSHSRSGKRLSLDDLNKQGFKSTRLPDGRVYELIPAQIPARADEGGGIVAVYPGTRESVIEECLIYFATKGEFSPQKGMPGYLVEGTSIKVLFTLNQLRCALEMLGKAYKSEELREGLLVLSLARYRFSNAAEREKVSSYIVSDLDSIPNPGESDAIRSDRIYCVEFDSKISKRILDGHYRSYDAECSMRMRSPIARYLYKQLTHSWLNANTKGENGAFHSIMQNETLLMSGTPYSDNPTKRKSSLLEALHELAANQIIMPLDLSADVVQKKRGREIYDVEFVVRPTPLFVKQQIDGHRRMKKSLELGDQIKLNNKSRLRIGESV